MPNSLEGKIAVVRSEPPGADRRNRRQSPGKQEATRAGYVWESWILVSSVAPRLGAREINRVEDDARAESRASPEQAVREAS